MDNKWTDMNLLYHLCVRSRLCPVSKIIFIITRCKLFDPKNIPRVTNELFGCGTFS